ncbi:MAG: transporter [Proteobacteria bacterium]|nr:transporter [Pseudomonadota bacterium]
MSGYLPPPGTYVQDNNYFYGGSTSATLEYNGVIVSGGVDAQAYYNLPTALWVAPEKVLGGNIAFNAITPIGYKNVDAGLELSGPGGAVIGSGGHDDETRFGDPVLGSSIGWHSGNWHWNLGTLVNVPLGFWQRGNLASIGFNHWAIDTTGAVTWLNPSTGLEISTAAGFTYNFENTETNYKTGTEFHLEFAAIQNLSKALGIGVNGYFYDQVTGDSGSGAKLGSFEGRVFAIGPAVNVNFALGKIPVSANLKYFHEMDVQNRLQGDAGYLTLTMPLAVAGH